MELGAAPSSRRSSAVGRKRRRRTVCLAAALDQPPRGVIEFRNGAQAARPARRADPPLSARLPVLLQPARARCEGRRARHRDLGARLRRGGCARCPAGASVARRDLVDIAAGAHAAGLYTNLITSAVGITEKTLGALAGAGLDHVQISIQDSDAPSADHIAGYDGAFARKRALAAEVVRHKLPLTVNAVVHRANIDGIGGMVDLALALGASRVEIAHVQYYG